MLLSLCGCGCQCACFPLLSVAVSINVYSYSLCIWLCVACCVSQGVVCRTCCVSPSPTSRTPPPHTPHQGRSFIRSHNHTGRAKHSLKSGLHTSHILRSHLNTAASSHLLPPSVPCNLTRSCVLPSSSGCACAPLCLCAVACRPVGVCCVGWGRRVVPMCCTVDMCAATTASPPHEHRTHTSSATGNTLTPQHSKNHRAKRRQEGM
jgi:hypothetical protein